MNRQRVNIAAQKQSMGCVGIGKFTACIVLFVSLFIPRISWALDYAQLPKSCTLNSQYVIADSMIITVGAIIYGGGGGNTVTVSCYNTNARVYGWQIAASAPAPTPTSTPGGSGCNTTGTSILMGNGSGGCGNATAGTQYQAPIASSTPGIAGQFVNGYTAPGTFTYGAPSGSGGGGTGGAADLITNVQAAPYNATGKGVLAHDGAMTSGGSTLTSTTTTFTSAMVGYPITVCGASATTIGNQLPAGTLQHWEKAGTISSFIDAHDVGLSFPNSSGAALSNTAYVFGPDDTAALNSAFNSGASHLYIPKGIYMVTGGLTFPSTQNADIGGSGSGLPYNWYNLYENGYTGLTTNPGSWIWYATTSLSTTTPGLMLGNSAASNSYPAQSILNQIYIKVHDLSLIAGCGATFDGAGGDGIDSYYVQHTYLDRVGIENFAGVDFYNTQWGNYIESDRGYFTFSGTDCIKTAPSTIGGFSYNSGTLLWNNEIEACWHNGINLGGTTGSGQTTNPFAYVIGNLIQWNNLVNQGSPNYYANIYIAPGYQKNVIQSNYIEAGNPPSGTNMLGIFAPGPGTGPDILNNMFSFPNNNYYDYYLGGTGALTTTRIEGNSFTHTTAWPGKGLNFLATSNLTAIDNNCGGTLGNCMAVPESGTLAGTTAGNYSCSESIANGNITVTCLLNGYQNSTTTPQTVTFPWQFSQPPVVANSPCGSGTGIGATVTTLTLPYGTSATAGSCNITAMGQ